MIISVKKADDYFRCLWHKVTNQMMKINFQQLSSLIFVPWIKSILLIRVNDHLSLNLSPNCSVNKKNSQFTIKPFLYYLQFAKKSCL